jgi:molecular chaperone HtpG
MEMEIRLPKRLSAKLGEDAEVGGQVTSALARFSRWFNQSGTPFFRQYTDHGCKHISEVLETAEQLVAEGAWDCLTSRDSAVLTFAILLHDAAMHIQEDGFLRILSGDWPPAPVAMLDRDSWATLWDEYLAQVNRFDRRQLKEVFGVEEPIPAPGLKHPEGWTALQFDFIGEFVRHNHPRLAHEIALSGVPGPETIGLNLGSVEADIRDLAGIVARSHGGPLRSYLPYLQNRYHLQDFAGVHAPFLMAVMRVADYLQLQAGRAPKEVLQVRSLRSPTSRREWQVHHAIRNITYNDPDPEAVKVQIDAHKTDLRTYLRLHDWLQGIQSELDVCWATLGEVYGRYTKDHLDRLGLSIRRIRSDFDDPRVFAKQVNYIPERIAFSTADAGLLQLLIQPLYGDRPEVGVRELLQNSVDAVRELEDYCERYGVAKESLDLIQQDADVMIELDVPNRRLTVSDRGIGMTVSTVRDYLLKAGASFRKSDAWRTEHESRPGESRVLRSGRFGVGALAAFLLGDKIRVTTRSVKETVGLTFTAQLIDDALELAPTDCRIGTMITVDLSDAALKFLSVRPTHQWNHNVPYRGWDWYCLEKPTVKRRVLMEKAEAVTVTQSYQWPGLNEDLPPSWRRLKAPPYADVHWSYEDLPSLVCNGIRIGNPQRADEYGRDSETRSRDTWFAGIFQIPTVSVFDPNGALPLTLTREKLTVSHLPFGNILQNDVIRDFLAYCIVSAPIKPLVEIGKKTISPFVAYPGFSNSCESRWTDRYARSTSGPVWVQTDKGVVLPDGHLIQRMDVESIAMFAPQEDAMIGQWYSYISKVPFLDLRAGHQHPRAGGIREILYGWGASASSGLAGIPFVGARFLVASKTAAEWNRPGKLVVWYRSALKEQCVGQDWVIWTIGECADKRPVSFQGIVEEQGLPTGTDSVFLAEKFISKGKIKEKCSPVIEAWLDLIGPQPIPFRPEDRRAKLSHAYSELRDYIQRWSRQLAVKANGT